MSAHPQHTTTSVNANVPAPSLSSDQLNPAANPHFGLDNQMPLLSSDAFANPFDTQNMANFSVTQNPQHHLTTHDQNVQLHLNPNAPFQLSTFDHAHYQLQQPQPQSQPTHHQNAAKHFASQHLASSQHPAQRPQCIPNQNTAVQQPPPQFLPHTGAQFTSNPYQKPLHHQHPQQQQQQQQQEEQPQHLHHFNPDTQYQANSQMPFPQSHSASTLDLAREHAALMSALASPLDSWPAALGELHTSGTDIADMDLQQQQQQQQQGQNPHHHHHLQIPQSNLQIINQNSLQTTPENALFNATDVHLAGVNSTHQGNISFTVDPQCLQESQPFSDFNTGAQNFDTTPPMSNAIPNNISEAIHAAMARTSSSQNDALSAMPLSFTSPSISNQSGSNVQSNVNDIHSFPTAPPPSARSTAGQPSSAFEPNNPSQPDPLDIGSPLAQQHDNDGANTSAQQKAAFPGPNASQNISVSISSGPSLNPQDTRHAESLSSKPSAPAKSSLSNDVSGEAYGNGDTKSTPPGVPPFVSRLEFTAMPPMAPNLTSPSPRTPLTGPPTRGFRGSGGTIATKPSPPPTPAASAAARGLRKRARAAARAASCSPLPPADPTTPPNVKTKDENSKALLQKENDSTSNAASASGPGPSDSTATLDSKTDTVVSKQTANNRVVAAMEQAKRNHMDMDAPDLAPLNKRAQRIIRTREAASRNRQEQKAKMLRLKTTNETLLQSKSALESEKSKLVAQLEQLRLLVASPLLAQVSETLVAGGNSGSAGNSSDFMPEKAASTASSE